MESKFAAYRRRRIEAYEQAISQRDELISALREHIQQLEEELMQLKDTRIIMKSKPPKKRITKEDERAKRWNLIHK